MKMEKQLAISLQEEKETVFSEIKNSDDVSLEDLNDLGVYAFSKEMPKEVLQKFEHIDSPQKLAQYVINVLTSSLEEDFADRTYSMCLVNIVEALARNFSTEQKIQEHKKNFAETIVQYIKDRISDSNQENNGIDQFIVRFEQLFLSSAPNIFDGIGDIAEQIDFMSQLRAVPKLSRYYDDQLQSIAYDYGFARSDGDEERYAKKFANVIKEAPVSKKFQLIYVFKDVVVTGSEMASNDFLVPIIKSALEKSRNQSALLDIVIDDVENDVDAIFAQDEDLRRELDSPNFWRNISVDALGVVPEEYAHLNAHVVSSDVVGLANEYGDITHFIKYDHAKGLVGTSDITQSEEFLIRSLKMIRGSRVSYGDQLVASRDKFYI